MNKTEAIAKFGTKVVDLAESFYETDFGKYFWADLKEEEKSEYLQKAVFVVEFEKTNKE